MSYELLLYDKLVWNLPLLFLLLSLTFLYLYFLKYTWKQQKKKICLFLLASSLLYLLIGSPISAFSQLNFSFHMLQMSILFFIIPPLFIAGTPAFIIARLKFKWLDKLFLPPIFSLILFASLFLLYHLPIAFHLFANYPFLQHGGLFFLFILAFQLWWPLLSPLQNKRLSQSARKRYLFWSGALLLPACGTFIFQAFISGSENPLLQQLTAHLCFPADVMADTFNTTHDQVIAGTVMIGVHKIGMMLSNRLV